MCLIEPLVDLYFLACKLRLLYDQPYQRVRLELSLVCTLAFESDSWTA